MGEVIDPVIVAVDGGGTKTDIAICALDGTLVTRSRLGTFAPHLVGLAQTVKYLDAAVGNLLAGAGRPPVAAAAVCFCDIDFPFEAEDFRAGLAEHSWAGQKLFSDNDMFALLRTGTDEATAVAVVCGTGTNCVGRSADGRVVRFAAIGDVSGDWGGGAGLGQAAIWHSARAADGRGPATALEPLLVRALGRDSMDEVILGFHVGELSYSDIPQLVPLIFEAASTGDEVANMLIDRQADEIVALATAALRRLDVLGRPCPVVLGGGVIAARHACLLEAIDQKLARQAPLARPVIISEPPIIGAACLAFDLLGAGKDVFTAVRHSLGQLPATTVAVAP